MAFLLGLILSAESFALDELYVKEIASATANGPAILFVGLSGMNAKTYLFNMETETGTVLANEKIQIMFPGVNATSSGFVLDETMGNPKLVHIDKQGEYVTRQFLREFSGWPDHLILKTIQGNENNLFANFESQNRDTVVVAKIDTAGQQITRVHHIRQDKHLTVRFYPWKDGYLMLNHRNGLLQKLSGTFDDPHTIRPATEPLLVDPARPIARRMKYLSMVWPTSKANNRMVFVYNKKDPFDKSKYPDPIRLALILEDDNLTESDSFILGDYMGKQLLFYFRDQEFELKK
jgi:hypothetical protein